MFPENFLDSGGVLRELLDFFLDLGVRGLPEQISRFGGELFRVPPDTRIEGFY